MALARTLTGLEIVKPIARIVPVVGTSAEALIELIIQACKAAESVQSNKEVSIALSERAALLGAIIVCELRKLDEETLKRRTGDVQELLLLIQEIKLSHERRAARSWSSRTWRKDDDKEEIKALSNKLDKAVERFGISSLFAMKGGLDAIVSGLQEVKAEQVRIQEAQITMAASQAVIEKTVISSEEIALLDTLKPVDEARHDVQNAPPGCLKGTREHMIRLLVDWATDVDLEESIFWLSGLGGVGKTTIARTVCDQLATLGVLGAAFFISRSSADRTNPQNIVCSIVHQLAHYQPELCAPICDVLRKNRMITTQAMSFQVPALLCEPLRLAAGRLKRPIVLVIDALDECDKDEAGRYGSDLLPLLLSAFHGSALPVKLLVASRLERSIHHMFAEIKPTEFRLHEIDKSVVRADIQLYLEHSFRMIAADRKEDIEPPWPSKENLDELTDLSDGLFIFAVTVVKHVGNPRHIPVTRLNDLLSRKLDDQNKSPSSYEDLDRLYIRVLSSALGEDARYHETIAQRLRKLLGVLIVLYEPLTVGSLSYLLDLDEKVLRLDLESLSAVILVPDKGYSDTIQFFHTSFEDFLSDPSRCTDSRFLIETRDEFHGLVSIRCSELQLWYLKRKDSELDGLPDSHTRLLEYTHLNSLLHLNLLGLTATKKIIDLNRERLQHCPMDHPDWPELIGIFSRSLRLGFEQGGGAELLKEAVDVGRRGLAIYPQGHPDRDMPLDHLASALFRQHEHSGGEDVLAEAICLLRESLELCPRGRPYRDMALNNLASALLRQFEQTGGHDVLTEATGLLRESLELCPRGHPNRERPLSNLANVLITQFEQTSEEDVLSEAIGLYHESLELCPRGDPTRGSSLSNLANALLLQFRQTGGEDVLAKAIRLNRESLELRPRDHPHRNTSLNNLATTLLTQFEKRGGEDVLAEAICLYRESLGLRPPGHPNRDMSLTNLASALQIQFQNSNDISILEEAIVCIRQTLEIQTPGHWRRSYALGTLASLLEKYANATHNAEASTKAQNLRREAKNL